jgi:hypothetical protein
MDKSGIAATYPWILDEKSSRVIRGVNLGRGNTRVVAE